MNFIEGLAEKLAQIKRTAENIPQQIDSALLSLDKGKLARIFWRLTEGRFQLEQQGRPNSKVLIGNGIIEVRDIPAQEMLHLQNQGYIILDWTQYRRLLKELGKVITGRGAQAGNASRGEATLDLLLEAEETRPQGIPPSFQLELTKIDHTLQKGLSELRKEGAKRDREWQLTLKRWDEEKQLRSRQFRKEV